MRKERRKSRREFLKDTGALAAGAVLVTSCHAERPTPETAVTARSLTVKKILIVVVGDPQGEEPVHYNAGPLPSDLRPIIRHLVTELAGLRPPYAPYSLGTHYTIDYLQDRNQDLRGHVRRYLSTHPTADLAVFTIGSSATIAAFRGRQGLPGALIPIVFTVISNPEHPDQGFHNPNEPDPLKKHPRITGVKTNLAYTVTECINILGQLRSTAPNGRLFLVQTFTTRGHPAAKEVLTQYPPSQHPTLQFRHTYLADDGQDLLLKIDALNAIDPGTGRRACILVLPDDAVYAQRGEAIKRAQGKGIPIFFQQVETVLPSPTTKTLSAFGAYGMPPSQIGLKAAELMSRVLGDAEEASKQDIYTPGASDFVACFNKEVATDLQVAVPAIYCA